jgi:hypothetical protein
MQPDWSTWRSTGWMMHWKLSLVVKMVDSGDGQAGQPTTIRSIFVQLGRTLGDARLVVGLIWFDSGYPWPRDTWLNNNEPFEETAGYRQLELENAVSNPRHDPGRDDGWSFDSRLSLRGWSIHCKWLSWVRKKRRPAGAFKHEKWMVTRTSQCKVGSRRDWDRVRKRVRIILKASKFEIGSSKLWSWVFKSTTVDHFCRPQRAFF